MNYEITSVASLLRNDITIQPLKGQGFFCLRIFVRMVFHDVFDGPRDSEKTPLWKCPSHFLLRHFNVRFDKSNFRRIFYEVSKIIGRLKIWSQRQDPVLLHQQGFDIRMGLDPSMDKVA